MSDWLVRQLFEEDRKRVEKGEVRNNETSKTIRINVCYECSFLLDDPNKELKSLNVLGNYSFSLSREPSYLQWHWIKIVKGFASLTHFFHVLFSVVISPLSFLFVDLTL